MNNNSIVSQYIAKTYAFLATAWRSKSLLGGVLLVGVSGSALLLQGLTASAAKAEDQALTQAQQQSVQAIVKRMLIEDPDLLKQAIIALQQRESQTAQAVQQQALAAKTQALFESELDPWKGAQNPSVTIAYFTDFNCPYCKKLEPELDRLMATYPELKVVVKMVPLQGEGSEQAVDLAQSVWLNEPSKYLAVKDTLMASPRRLDSDSIAKVANLTKTTPWLNHTDPKVDDIVDANLNLMRELGIGGTPAIIMGNKIIPGLVSYDVLKQHLDDYIEASS
ncbi:DsbA family protein [Shewanella sp. Scap07]|uniref:DsbA family protein n=1 Tax=Shewanella sp. Scap07 TaxID=2589987 RepID=UPI0015BBA319|nr:DsbA family protein [Shewanella sp. Scap07]QLE86541.1 DsbA family protein [Shewanella sp. Scap07]